MRHQLLRVLSLLAVALVIAGCRSHDDVSTNGHSKHWPASGDIVYTRVGMHFEVSRGRYRAYSTNYIGLPKHLPAGTWLRYHAHNRERIVLFDENDSEYVITFVAKHSMMTINEYIARHFSSEPIELSNGFTTEEQEAIAEGRARRGISRDALFLAVGYPPKSLSPSPNDDLLTYEWRRFREYRVRFGDDDRVVRLGR